MKPVVVKAIDSSPTGRLHVVPGSSSSSSSRQSTKCTTRCWCETLLWCDVREKQWKIFRSAHGSDKESPSRKACQFSELSLSRSRSSTDCLFHGKHKLPHSSFLLTSFWGETGGGRSFFQPSNADLSGTAAKAPHRNRNLHSALHNSILRRNVTDTRDKLFPQVQFRVFLTKTKLKKSKSGTETKTNCASVWRYCVQFGADLAKTLKQLSFAIRATTNVGAHAEPTRKH